MAQLSLVKSSGGILIPSTPDTREYLNRLAVGAVICGEFKKARNPAFHRKYFSLLGLGFDYWERPGVPYLNPSAISFVDSCAISQATPAQKTR